MFVVGNILIGLAQMVGGVLLVYQWILIARAIVSWVNADPRNKIVQFLAMVTDPVVERARRLLPMKLRYFPLDVAFLLVFGLTVFLRFALVQTMLDLGQRLRTPSLQGETLRRVSPSDPLPPSAGVNPASRGTATGVARWQ